jgi:hypothetical protein
VLIYKPDISTVRAVAVWKWGLAHILHHIIAYITAGEPGCALIQRSGGADTHPTEVMQCKTIDTMPNINNF